MAEAGSNGDTSHRKPCFRCASILPDLLTNRKTVERHAAVASTSEAGGALSSVPPERAPASKRSQGACAARAEISASSSTNCGDAATNVEPGASGNGSGSGVDGGDGGDESDDGHGAGGFTSLLPKEMMVREEFLSTVSAFDQHLNEQATAALWIEALRHNAGLELSAVGNS